MARISELDKLGCYDKKIFVVGNNKTGTTSLELYFKNLGFNTADQSEGEHIAFKHFFEGDGYAFLERILPYIEKYEVFQDVPFSLKAFLPILLKYYPDSKFIYSIRWPFAWFRSLVNHHSRLAGFSYALNESPEGSRIVFDVDDMLEKVLNWHYLGKNQAEFMMLVYNLAETRELYNQDKYIKYHIEHRVQAAKLLKGKDALFVDITRDNLSALKIAAFMKIPEEFSLSMPKENAALYQS